MSHPQFAAIVACARRQSGMTAAEMDYSLSTGDTSLYGAIVALRNATWHIANPDAHEFGADGTNDRARALWNAIRPDFDAMVTAAQGKTYLGWSTAARAAGQKIRYATKAGA